MEKVAPGDMSGLTGLETQDSGRSETRYSRRKSETRTTQGKNLIPYLKATLIWS
jgi:hypothetical protein